MAAVRLLVTSIIRYSDISPSYPNSCRSLTLLYHCICNNPIVSRCPQRGPRPSRSPQCQSSAKGDAGDTGSRRGRSLRLCFLVFLSSFQMTAHFAHASVRTFYLDHWLRLLKDRNVSMPGTGSRLRSVSIRVCQIVNRQDTTRERSWVTIAICRAPA